MADMYDLRSIVDIYKKDIDAIKEKGPEFLANSLQNSIDNWKESSLNIGVTGRSGVGKSSLINTLRGLTGECSDAAATGATETTREAKAYPHPDNKKLVFWDLPGIGTKDFPRNTYFNDKRVQFDMYDMYLILSSERFFEEDYLLAATAQKMNKLILFIRTKIDVDIESQRKTKPLQFRNDENATEKLLGQIRDEVKKGLSFQSLATEDTVFLVDGLDMTWNNFDFGKLITRLIDGFDGLKRESFILTLNVLHANVIEKKVDVLRKRRLLVSLKAAVVAVASHAISADVILKEVMFYQEQLGISNKDIEKTSNMLTTDVKTITALLKLKSFAKSWTTQGVAKYMDEIATTEEAKILAEMAEKASPIVKLLFPRVVSFASAYLILGHTIDMMASDAKALNTFVLSKTVSHSRL